MGRRSTNCVMFMHENVRRFVVSIPPEVSLPFAFFQDVVSRMPNITYLDLRTNIPMSSFQDEALVLFCGLEKLKTIILPLYHFTTRVAEVLSRLDDLEVVEFQYAEQQGCGDLADTKQFSPSLEQGAFPSLRELNFAARLEDTSRFMSHTYAPTKITVLFIDSTTFESPSDIHDVLSIIAENCRLLKSLSLLSVDGTVVLDNPRKEVQINIGTLKPLFNCSTLTTLELMHQFPFDLRLEDIEEFASKLSSLECLSLNNDPAVTGTDQSSLTLEALLPFARHCPNLQSLGLFLHASTAVLPSHQPEPSSSYHSFRNLKRLAMGVSSISEEGPVALFLSQICPLGCTLDSGVTWERTSASSEVLATIEIQCEMWKKVNELLPLLTKLRVEERERTRALLSEVEDLRIRTRLLADNAAVNDDSGCVVS